MKNYKSILLIVLGLFTHTSCNDFLCQEPITDLTPDQVFQSADAIQLLLNAAYDPMGWEYNEQFGDSYTMPYIYTDVRSDDIIVENYFFQAHSHGFENFKDLKSTNINVEGIWNKFFTGVAASNEVIRGLSGDQTDSPLSQAQIDVFLGEALFLRGYYYFEIVKNFGDAPLFDETAVSPTSPADQLKRKPAAMIYEQVEEDFKKASHTTANHTVYSI